MKLSVYQFTFAINESKLIQYMYSLGYTCTKGEAWRTPEMAEIYAKKGIGIKDSQHCKRLAQDLNLFKDGVFLDSTDAHRIFGRYWKSLNPQNRWGGDWDDGNHYEMREG